MIFRKVIKIKKIITYHRHLNFINVLIILNIYLELFFQSYSFTILIVNLIYSFIF